MGDDGTAAARSRRCRAPASRDGLSTPAARRPLTRAALVGLLLAAASAMAQAPARVASLNLCTDTMLLELLDDARIVSLTRLARDPDLNPAHARAARLPVNHGAAEEVLVTAPDLVVTAGHAPPLAARLLEQAGIALLVLPAAESFGAYADNLVRLAAALDTPARARALLDELWRSLGTRVPAPAAAAAPRALIYQPNGYTPGTHTLAHAMLRHAGLRDVAAELGRGSGGFVSLEELLLAVPDVLVFPARRAGTASLAEAMLAHPALASLRASAHAPRTLHIAPALWTCAGLHGLRAVRQLAAAAR
ncbi:MAG: ABC transporter substrate-binding protein [Gammaproteobacteria bacterium]